jgi:quercetin dioxygenase-like cupin family protein
MAIAREVESTAKKERVTFLETSSETGGAYTRMRVELGPDGGAQPHYHRVREEIFTVLEGELEMTLDGEVRRLNAGETLSVSKGATHGFWNRSDDPVVFEVKLVPGHLGFENVTRVGAGLERDGLVNKKGVPKGFPTLCLMAEWSETLLPGPFFALLAPIFRWGARRAEARGLAAELIERYDGELPA